MNESGDDKPDRVLDIRGSLRPLALLNFTHAFNEMKLDEILECVGQDPTTLVDLFKVLPPVSFEIVAREEFEDRYFRILIRKKNNLR